MRFAVMTLLPSAATSSMSWCVVDDVIVVDANVSSHMGAKPGPAALPCAGPEAEATFGVCGAINRPIGVIGLLGPSVASDLTVEVVATTGASLEAPEQELGRAIASS